MRRVLPEGVFAPLALLTQVVPVVRKQDDYGLLRAITRIQCVEEPAYHRVCEGDAGKVRLDPRLPVAGLKDPPMDPLVPGVPFGSRNIAQVVRNRGRQLYAIERMLVEVCLRHVPRDMRPVNADSEEQGLAVLRLQLPSRPRDDLAVPHRAVLGGHRRPVEEPADKPGVLVDWPADRPDLVRKLPVRSRVVVVESASRQQAVELYRDERRGMKQLAAAQRPVAVALQEARQHGLALQQRSFPPVLVVEIDAEGRRQHPAHQ